MSNSSAPQAMQAYTCEHLLQRRSDPCPCQAQSCFTRQECMSVVRSQEQQREVPKHRQREMVLSMICQYCFWAFWYLWVFEARLQCFASAALGWIVCMHGAARY